MCDCALEFPKTFTATGLNPEELAKNDQEFVIYNPKVERFWDVSTERNDHYLIAVPYYMMCFKLKDLGNAEYNIVTMDRHARRETGFVFLSEIPMTEGVNPKSRRVMRSNDVQNIPAYKFTFIKHREQNGVYKIKCAGQVLYAMVKGNSIKADNRADGSDEIWFQLNISPNAEIETEIISTRKDIFHQDENTIAEEKIYENDGDETKELIIRRFYEPPLLPAYPDLTHTIELTSESKMKVKAKSKLCLQRVYSNRIKYKEESISVEFRGKTYTGYRLQKSVGSRGTNASIEDI